MYIYRLIADGLADARKLRRIRWRWYGSNAAPLLRKDRVREQVRRSWERRSRDHSVAHWHDALRESVYERIDARQITVRSEYTLVESGEAEEHAVVGP